MPHLPVLTPEAERTYRILGTVNAEYEVMSGSTGVRFSSEDVSLPRGESMDGNLLAISYVSRLVIRTEIFTFARVLELADAHVERSSDPMLEHLYKSRRKNLDSTWDSIKSVAGDWLGFPLSNAEGYEELLAYVEVRNSWAHGAGNLSTRQLRNRDEITRVLRKTGISVDGSRLVCPWDLVRQAMLDVRKFVAFFDVATRPEYSRLCSGVA